MASPSVTPFFTVVVPVHDGGAAFDRCLAALEASEFTDFELVVADDRSTDGSGDRARAAGARVVEPRVGGSGEPREGDPAAGRSSPLGPAAARNAGAAVARGVWLFFLDADCAIHADALGRAAGALSDDPSTAALFGSYDADPADPGVVSRYRNLLHHHVHHSGRAAASTFWAGCGAVRRDAFDAVGGFDAERYPRPSVEDIELGTRLIRVGHRIRLDPAVQATHLKAWSLAGMLRTDALARAAPWTELALGTGGFPRDLNTGLKGRVALAGTWGALLGLAASAVWPPLALAGLGIWCGAVLLERDLFRTIRRQGGLALAIAAVPLHALHHLAAGLGLAIGVARHLRGGRRRPGDSQDAAREGDRGRSAARDAGGSR